MSELSKRKGEPNDDKASRKNQILNLIRNKPMGWAELKNTTKLSNSTLFRILTNLEEGEIITKKLKDKKLQWVLTSKGHKKVKQDNIDGFMRTATQILTDGAIDYQDWKPRKQPIGEETKIEIHMKSKRPFHPEDEEYRLLLGEYTKNFLTNLVGKKFLERYRKEEPLFSTIVFPYIYTTNEPSSSSEIKQLCQTFVEKIVDEREQLYLSSLPKDDSLIDTSESYEKDAYTSRLLLVFQVELTAHKEKLESLLEIKKTQSKPEGHGNGAKN